MSSYTKVLARLVSNPGLVLTLTFTALVEADASKSQADEVLSVLKELGLDDSLREL